MSMNARGAVDLDPSVCYRHPGRQSWTLCERCGRTICPECQLLTPRGVQCPECVRESGGSVQWQPAGPQKPARSTPSPVQRLRPQRRGARTRRAPVRRPGGLLAALPSGAPVTWTVLAVALVLWILGWFTGDLPALLLAGIPGEAWQLWRFLTAPLVYPTALGLSGALSLLLSGVFFGLSGPQLERQLGRRSYLLVLGVAAVVGTAATLLAGGAAFGLTGPLFALFGSLLVLVWSDQRIRVQILVMIGLNLVLSLALGGGGLPALVGGIVAGAGTTWVLQGNGGRRRWLILGGVVALLAVLAVLRGLSA